MASRDLVRQLKGGNWADEAQIERFSQSAKDAERNEVLEMLEFLGDGSTRTGPPIAHKHRCRAFVAIIDANRKPELFAPLVEALEAADVELRGAIASLLPKLKDHQSQAPLCALLKSKDRALRKVAAHCLAQIGGKQTLDLLAGFVRESSFPGRMEAADAAAAFGREHAVAVLADIVEVGSSKERIHTLDLLADPQLVGKNTRGALRAILRVLADHDSAVVAHAIHAFCAHCGEANYFKSIAPFLDSTDLRLVKSALAGLARFSSPRALRALERAFRIGPSSIRLAALDVAEKIGTNDVLPLVVEALAHKNFTVRTQAARVLADLSADGRVDVGRSIVWLLRSNDPTVRRMAVEIAGRVKDESGELWPRLLNLLKDEDWWVRERVSDALTEMAGPELAAHVAELLNEPSEVVRRYAVLLLARIKNPEALGALVIAAQSDTDWWVREEAVKACGELGDTRAVPYLVDLLQREPQLAVACAGALGALRAKEAAQEVGELIHEDSETHVLLALLECLAALDDRGQAEHVARLQNHPLHQVREAARQLLKRWGTEIIEDTMRTIAQSLGKLEVLLHAAVEANADDLIISADRLPYIKREGAIAPLFETPVAAADLDAMISPLLTEEQKARLLELKDIDLSHEVKSHGLRFRVNVFQQTTGLSAVFRVLSEAVPDIEQLGLPKIVVALSEFSEGLILVGGPTGSGKSTTLAALIDRINATSRRHIITLEDPIEFVHRSKMSLVTQREIGKHSASYASVLRATLREDPDVILVGEMRDLPTISFAISAAETGHLVLATVHTVSADKSIDRVINAYPAGQQPQVRSMLSGSLRAVLCQQLLRRADGKGRVLAIEILLNTDAVANLIRKEKTFQIPSLIATSKEQGMQAMDDALRQLLYDEVITPEEGYLKANDKDAFAAIIRNKP